MELILREPTEEVITKEDLRELLETTERPVAYDGFEPSGIMHLGTGLLRGFKLQDFLDAKVEFILYLADWFAFLNNKLGGNIEKIRKCGEYFIEGWKACGVDVKKIKVVWCSDVIKDPEYWETFLRISKLVTLKRTLRAVTIAGRKEAEVKNPSLIIYPLMQATDIFMLNDKKGVDICQLGMDQRKVNMLSREIAPKLGRRPPVCVHHHLLLGLQAGKMEKDISEIKMSKSKPMSAIFIHDSDDEIREKLRRAFCPPSAENNPVLEIVRYIIFRKFDVFDVKAKSGEEKFSCYEDVEKAFLEQKIHPLDLKEAVAEKLCEIIKPIREYFEKNKRAKELYETVVKMQITR